MFLSLKFIHMNIPAYLFLSNGHLISLGMHAVKDYEMIGPALLSFIILFSGSARVANSACSEYGSEYMMLNRFALEGPDEY